MPVSVLTKPHQTVYPNYQMNDLQAQTKYILIESRSLAAGVCQEAGTGGHL